MKREFAFQLDAKKFLPLFLAFFIPWLILEVLTVVQNRRVEAMTVSTAGILALLLLIAALILLTVLFYIPILRKLVPAVLFDNETFQFRGSIGKFFGLNLLGIFLTVITLGIYLPAAYIKVYRYLVGHTEIQTEQKQEGRLGFRGRSGWGFGLLWGQILLTTVTLGVYAPWALAKVGKWFLSNTYVEPS